MPDIRSRAADHSNFAVILLPINLRNISIVVAVGYKERALS